MHELSVMKQVIAIALDVAKSNNVTKIISIELEIGALSDFEPQWMTKYFDILASDTIASEAKLKVTKKNGFIKCLDCNKTSEVVSKNLIDVKCSYCRADASFIGDSDYIIKSIEVV